MKKFISQKKAKQILLEEINKLIEEEQLDVRYNLFDTKSTTFKETQKKVTDQSKMIRGMYNSYNKSIVYFINSTLFFTEETFIDLLKDLLHEVHHAINYQKLELLDQKSLFIHFYEENLKIYENEYYFENWKHFFCEKAANLYGIVKTEEIIKNNYPEMFNRNKNYINKKRDEYEFEYINYEFNNLYTKHYNDFIHKEGGFKTVNYIYELYKDFTPEISYIILSTDLFLKQLDINALTTSEINIMIEALNFKYTDLVIKLEYFKSLFNDNLRNSSYYTNLLEKIDDIKEVIYLLKNKKDLKALEKCKRK